jgi:MYXO-CTERM domain-containing protein
LLLRYTPSGTSQLYRSGAGEFFAVIDSSRSGCPVLPNAAARCDAPETFSAPVRRYAVLGYAPELKAVLVSVDTTQGRTLYGVTNDGLLWLADLTSAFGGLPPVNLLPLEPAGSSGYLVHAQATLNTYSQFGTFELDPAFQERPPPRRFVDAAGRSGQFFRTGYLDRIHTEYLLEPLQPGLPPRYVPRQFEVEWEPVPPELRPGEVISFGRFRQRFNGAAGQVLFNPVTGVFEDSVTFNTPGWILWRTTPTGATVEWLMREEFEAQLSAADRAVLAATPLGTIRSMNASPDGRKLCLAEPAAVRTWELLLDASGRLEGARLASTSAGVGCAYDDASELVTLTKGPVEVRRGATVLGSVTPITQPIGLYRAGGYWLVQGYLEPLHCVSDAGAITSSGVIVTAMSVVTGGVAYIQKDGHGFIATVDDFCQARGPSERLSSTDHTLWSTLFSRFTYRSVNAVQASMVMRPDGVMLVSGFEFDVSGLGSNPQVVPALTFHLWPRFAPVSPEKRFPAHDGFRIVQDVADVNSTAAIALQAMTIIPGASPSRDWGYVKRQGTPVSTAGDPPDAGVPDAGLPGGEPGPKDPPPCGCASSGPEGPLFALLLVLAASARAKRREVLDEN